MSLDNEPEVIDRREAIKRVSVLLGGAALVGGSSLLASCGRVGAAVVERARLAGTSASAHQGRAHAEGGGAGLLGIELRDEVAGGLGNLAGARFVAAGGVGHGSGNIPNRRRRSGSREQAAGSISHRLPARGSRSYLGAYATQLTSTRIARRSQPTAVRLG